MLYVEITTLEQFCKHFPRSRQENYTLPGLNALFEYWSGQASEVDYTVNESLDYDCMEYDSARKALQDADCGRLWELQLELATKTMEEAGEDPEDNPELLTLWAMDCDAEDLEERAEKELAYHYRHAERLSNGNVFTVNK